MGVMSNGFLRQPNLDEPGCDSSGRLVPKAGLDNDELFAVNSQVIHNLFTFVLLMALDGLRLYLCF